MFRALSRFILKRIGWRITGHYPHEVKKKILVAAPHTSNWDFPLGIMIRSVLNDDIKFVGKASLFKGPLGSLFHRLGGISVDRSKSNNFVSQVVAEMDKRDSLNILLAGEGTRKKVERFKTGFYHIARNAKVPILPTILDYEKKEFRFGPLFTPTSDTEADIKLIESLFKGIKGHNPEYGFYFPTE